MAVLCGQLFDIMEHDTQIVAQAQGVFVVFVSYFNWLT
jgi:hypothetical protein